MLMLLVTGRKKHVLYRTVLVGVCVYVESSTITCSSVLESYNLTSHSVPAVGPVQY